MMARYKCNWCGVVVTYRKKRNVPNKKWIPSICGNTNDKDVHLVLIEGGKDNVKSRRSKN